MADTTMINTVLAEIIQSAAAVKDFVVTETPLVIEELVKWKILENGLDIFVGITLCLIAIFSSVKLAKLDPRGDFAKNSEGLVVLWFIFSVLISLISVVFFLSESLPSLYELLQLVVAPKVWLLEYAKDLVTPAVAK